MKIPKPRQLPVVYVSWAEKMVSRIVDDDMETRMELMVIWLVGP